MTSQIEHRQHQLETRTIAGLIALAIGSLAEAARVTAIDRGWISEADTVERALLLGWIVGLVVFGLVFTSLWWLGRRLDRKEREALGDELQLFLSRRNAVVAFVATFVAATLIATIPAAADLPGRAVALAIVAVATGTLALGRIIAARS